MCNFKDVVSCKIKEGIPLSAEIVKGSKPCVVPIEINSNTNTLLSITVWSKSVAIGIDNLMQNIIRSNGIFLH